MLDYRQLKALSSVIEEQSFEKAALRLNITQSAVSQRIKQLEELIGQALLIRSQPILPTPAGKILLKHFRQVDLLQNEVIQSLSSTEQSGHTVLSIGINADSLATWFLPAIEPLLKQHKILIDLKIDDQDQTQKFLKNGEVMGCITSSSTPLQGCHCIPLGVSVYRCVASLEYIERHFPDGPSATAFRYAPVVEFNHKDALQQRYLKQFFKVNSGTYPSHRVPSSEAFMDLIIRGLATGMVPDQQVRPFLESGHVTEILPNSYLSVPLYWHVWNLKAPLAQELTQTLTQHAAIALEDFDAHPTLTIP
ncbi:LysR family transcriptional regulator ArgP [Neptunomonas concharum]|uniref:LysR family transcriptional regulator ArgP n=1 Tax=Neptunomonas concharum TaxID=1031538 RepID=A0A5P1RDC7_9GAMM|nr:LysR family transcriptional regulator ArgP [Neptunomonas concharum]QEQ97613.1 LysR family transcriptional regulator ArgP [Neptunomonas concharum]